MRKLRLRKKRTLFRVTQLVRGEARPRNPSRGSQPLHHTAAHPARPPFMACSFSPAQYAPWWQMPSFTIAPLTMCFDRSACLHLSLGWELPEGRDDVLFILVPQCSAQCLAQNKDSGGCLLTDLY